jgi:outer membrane protein OmpA-like peptidoglycan-associated protein
MTKNLFMLLGRTTILTIFFVGHLANVFAQDDDDPGKATARILVEVANEAYSLSAISQARDQFLQAVEMDPENIDANFMSGKTLLEIGPKANATEYLLKASELNPNHKMNLDYLIGMGYHHGLKFEKAKEYYRKYLQKLSGENIRGGKDYVPPDLVERKIAECDNGMELVSAPFPHAIENVGPAINSEWPDFAPVVTADESLMVFTTRRQDGNSNLDVFEDLLYYEDVFYSEKSGGTWQPAKNIGMTVNIIYHSSNLAINADGTELYLFKSQNGGDIFVSRKSEMGTWSEPEPLNDNINSTYSENSVSISPDGNTLYFSSDRPITPNKTDLDIYVCKKNRKGEWGVAKSLSPAINTPYDEDGPFIDYDGKTLYFSSKGHKGMGGYDIYKSVYDEQSDSWSQPVNLGYPINSPDDDVYFVSTRDGKRGYYASAKEDALGYLDIYQVRLADIDTPPPAPTAQFDESKDRDPPAVVVPVKQPKPVMLAIKTVDRATQMAVDANVTVSHPQGGSVHMRKVGIGRFEGRFTNDNDIKYNVSVEKAGYMYKKLVVAIPAMSMKGSMISREIALDKIQTGYKQVIRNVYFDFGTARLQEASFPELNKLLKVLTENPQYVIEIAGHTDNVGGKDFNNWLSKRRAQSVVDYLVQQGQEAGRFVVEGYGEDKPLASNDDEEWGRELNRRVEFKVLQPR